VAAAQQDAEDIFPATPSSQPRPTHGSSYSGYLLDNMGSSSGDMKAYFSRIAKKATQKPKEKFGDDPRQRGTAPRRRLIPASYDSNGPSISDILRGNKKKPGHSKAGKFDNFKKHDQGYPSKPRGFKAGAHNKFQQEKFNKASSSFPTEEKKWNTDRKGLLHQFEGTRPPFHNDYDEIRNQIQPTRATSKSFGKAPGSRKPYDSSPIQHGYSLTTRRPGFNSVRFGGKNRDGHHGIGKINKF
jgi:hypothetical protein